MTPAASKSRTQFGAIWRRIVVCALLCLAPGFPLAVWGFSVAGKDAGEEMNKDSSAAILHELECFRQMGSVLFIAAHPDDENTELLAYLSRGRDLRTAYLSMTRGDGGQNVLGPELGDKLGVARTQELLAARRLDGARQFFSRAVDFGFSKNYTETLNIWNKQEVLSDVVRIIREFKPDVLITRFSPSPGGTHGHHTASAVLAQEAFKLAADPKAFPEQGLAPWQPKRVMWNISTFQRDKVVSPDALKIDVGSKDSVSGETFTVIAGKSRAMHKTQGFDTFKLNATNPRIESFQLLDGAPASKDILDDVDTSWNRVPGGAVIGKSVDELIAKFNAQDASASVPALLNLRIQLNALPKDDSILNEKRVLLDRILQDCLGLQVETTISQSDVVPGESIRLHHAVTVHSKVPVRWVAVNYPEIKKDVKRDVELKVNELSSFEAVETLPESTPLTQPWWLRKAGTPGLFGVEDSKLIGHAENAPAFTIEDIFEVDGSRFVVPDEPVHLTANSAGSQIRRRMDVIPPVSLHFLSDVALLKPSGSQSVEVEVVSARANTSGTLRLDLPSEWKVKPEKQSFHFAKNGEHLQFKFTITAPAKPSTANIIANAEINGVHYRNQREEINYPHIPPQLLQPLAALKAVSFNLETRGHNVGYLPGAGDSLPDNLRQMGYTVKMLDDTKPMAEQLSGLDAVVIGVRAFNVRTNIGTAMPALFDFVKDGGTVIAQYNRPDNLKADKIAPYDLQISPLRVTDEKSAVTFLAPDHPVLNSPNKISSVDFDNWVQERGIYFPNKWDEHFTPVLAFNDPGEDPVKGSLLVAQYGKGYFVYTGLVFFRQLPAGVPGAYRLFANLVSIGK